MKSLTNSLNVWFLLGGALGFHYDRALNDIQTWKEREARAAPGWLAAQPKCNRKATEI